MTLMRLLEILVFLGSLVGFILLVSAAAYCVFWLARRFDHHD